MSTAAVQNNSRADRFRQMAAKMADEITYKRTSGVASQRMTRRRAAMAEHASREADRMERVQLALVAIADATDAGTLPESLKSVASKVTIEEMIRDAGRPGALPAAHRDLLAIMPTERSGPSSQQAEVIRLERQLVGTKIPGFFPTPPAVINKMFELWGVGDATNAIEPSAGKGDIAEAIKARLTPLHSLDVCELNPTLRLILAAKGFNVVSHNCLEWPNGDYDCVMMNPPFERGQDMQHVRHAYETFLCVGGRIISVMSTGAFNNGTAKHCEFQSWFESVGGERFTVEGQAFAKGDARTGISTGVSTCIVLIDKSE